jgi:hypothetical protein
MARGNSCDGGAHCYVGKSALAFRDVAVLASVFALDVAGGFSSAGSARI